VCPVRADYAIEQCLPREEVQEEAKVLYQEWKRIKDVTFQHQIAVSDTQKELNELLAEEGLAQFELQSAQITELQP
jgi:hypothetical protein